MLELYGRLWEASYGHVDGDAFNAWRRELEKLDMVAIKIGLDAVVKEGSDHPPNLIKFLRLCRDGSANPVPRTYSQDNWSERWHGKLRRWTGDVPLEATEPKPWDQGCVEQQ